MSKKIYLIGSLRNPAIPEFGNELRALGLKVFDDWFAAGPEADDKWKEYETHRGRSYIEALEGEAATHVYEFDKWHLDSADGVVMLLPAGKSGHMEFGYKMGQGDPGWIVLDDPDRWDVMYKFATGVFAERAELLEELADWVSEEE